MHQELVPARAHHGTALGPYSGKPCPKATSCDWASPNCTAVCTFYAGTPTHQVALHLVQRRACRRTILLTRGALSSMLS